jgi:hypothetical protein
MTRGDQIRAHIHGLAELQETSKLAQIWAQLKGLEEVQ